MLNEWKVANAIIDGESSKLKGEDLSGINWFEVLQLIQGLLGEEIEEEAESTGDPVRDEENMEVVYQRVRIRAADFKVELPEEIPSKQ